MSERDPLDELKQLWSSLEPPAPASDPRERATGEWLRAAWAALEPAADDATDVDAPAVAWARAAFDAIEAPTAAEQAVAAEPERRRPRLALVTAGALAAAAAAVLLQPRLGAPGDTGPLQSIGEVDVASVDAPPAPTVHVSADGLELRSGPVRLLLNPPTLDDANDNGDLR